MLPFYQLKSSAGTVDFAFFGLSQLSAESWTQLRIDGALQLSWEISELNRIQPFFTEAQSLSGSVGPVWKQARASEQPGFVGLSRTKVAKLEASQRDPRVI